MNSSIQKLFYTTLFVFITLSILTIPTLQPSTTLRTNMMIEEESIPNKTTIYLLDSNQYLTEVEVPLLKDSILDTVKEIFSYLKTNNKSMKATFQGYIPSSAKIIECKWNNKILYLNVSKECKEDTILQGFIHSLLKLKDVEKVSIQVEGKYIEGYEGLLDENVPINSIYSYTNRNSIEKVVIYYQTEQNNQYYYVPVTKYLNQEKEKVEIIVEELKENIPTHLISVMSNQIKLLDYEENNNMMILNFNQREKEMEQQLAYSIFKNYDVSGVILKENNQIKEIISKEKS